MTDEIFESEQHSLSRRWAVFEDDGVAAWLYLTKPDDETPIADCWIYNRVPAPSPEEIGQYDSTPPPATSDYVDATFNINNLEQIQIEFLWSENGEAVAVLINQTPLGFIVLGHEGGYSRYLIKDGAWGNVWNENLFQATFITGNNLPS